MKFYSLVFIQAYIGSGSSFTLPSGRRSHISKVTSINFLNDKFEYVLPVTDPTPTHKQRPIRRSFLHQLDRFLTDLSYYTSGLHHLKNHTFLTGNYAPVKKEHVAMPVEVVEGEIPKELYGAFLRNGPNPCFEKAVKRYHWFDGHAMLHTLMFKDGEARYTNQFVPSPRFSIERELGEQFFPQLGEYKGWLGLLKIMFHSHLVKERIDDNKMVAPPNTNIMMYNKKLYCLHEANLPMEVRMHPNGRLEYVGYETFNGVLDYLVSAHPVQDGNDLLFHAYSVDEELIKEHGTMKVGRYNAESESVDIYLVPTPGKSHVSFAHSLIHTNEYIIVWDCSVHFSADALFEGGSFFKNNQDHTLKFGLIPKNAQSREEVIWIDSGQTGAIVHPLHVWEEIEELDNGEHRTLIKLWAPFCEDLELDLKQSNTFHMIEFSIDASHKTVSQQVIDDSISSEFAIMPPRPLHSSPKSICTTKVNNPDGSSTVHSSTLSVHDRYGFTAIFDEEGSGHFVGYAKWDMASGNRCLHSKKYYDNGEIGGEPMVVRASGKERDTIYVGSYVYNEEENQSYFLLFDGETNEQVCRLKMPKRVPYGFHGQFISGEDFESHFQYHEALDKEELNVQQCPLAWIRFFIKDLLGLGHI